MKIDALNLNTEHFIVEHLQGSPGNRQLIIQKGLTLLT